MCGNRVIPPQLCFVMMTFIVTLGPSLFQMLFIHAGISGYYVSKSEDMSMAAINIIYLITLFSSLFFLFQGSTTEPGIIPRVNNPLDEMLENVPYAYKQMILKQEERRKFFINKKLLIKSVKG